MTPVVISSIVVAIILVVGIAGFVMYSRRQTAAVDERLDGIVGKPAAPAKADAREKRPGVAADLLSRAAAGTSFGDNIKRDLARADIKLTVGEFMILRVISVLGVAIFGWFMGGGMNDPLSGVTLAFTLAGGVLGIFLPGFYVGFQQSNRLSTFDSQLGDMLNLVVNGLRAGYSVMQALESVGRELPAPIATEFKRLVQELQLGIPMEQGLANLCRRIPSKDLDFVVTAINVQREVGGNLAEILDSISFTIRERVRIKGEISTLTAQGMMTGYVVSGLPIGLGILLYVMNKSYMERFWTDPPIMFGIPICGISMLIIVALLIGIGFTIILKIVDIEV